ncbi:MAG TPA: transporter [Gracilimonas sp.]|nr:transporter [Gracilimonas sp.]
MKKTLSVILLLFFGFNLVQAQNYSPDRPGIGNGSFITPQGILGFEAGVQFSNTDLNKQFDVGQLVLRYGISEKLEFRALLGSFTTVEDEQFGGSTSYTGIQDMGVGFKYNLFSGDASSLSALAEISLPFGTEEFTNDETVPSIGVLADHALNEKVNISSNLGYSFDVGNVDDSWLFTLTPGFWISDNMNGYFGYAGNYYGNFEQHWVEGGITYGLESGAQLDLNFGYDTENEIAFIGIGFAKGY